MSHFQILRIAAILLLAMGGCGAGGATAAPPVPQSDLAPSLGVDLSAMERTASGLYVQTLREGRGAVAGVGQEVEIHYEGWLAEGTKFDSSRDRGQAIVVPIGQGVVIDAWDEGMVGMRVGEIRRLVVPPELGYGDEGVVGAIPPNATLVFELELLGFAD